MIKSQSDLAYEQIKQKIMNGEYHPSQRLVESHLTETLDVGRHNVRVALERLQSDGLVKIEPNRGATVASVTLEEALDTLAARKVLEVAAARLAAVNATDEQLDRLGGLVEALGAALDEGDFDTYSQTNKQLHATIYEAAGNHSIPWLIDLLRSKIARLQLRTVLIPGRSADSLAEHTNIYLALRQRDADAAEAAISTHMDNLQNTIKGAWSLVRS
ncbi:MAG: GntR family transcriptional regulator [Trueperaceae bacterium]